MQCCIVLGSHIGWLSQFYFISIANCVSLDILLCFIHITDTNLFKMTMEILFYMENRQKMGIFSNKTGKVLETVTLPGNMAKPMNTGLNSTKSAVCCGLAALGEYFKVN